MTLSKLGKNFLGSWVLPKQITFVWTLTFVFDVFKINQVTIKDWGRGGTWTSTYVGGCQWGLRQFSSIWLL